MAQIFFFLPNKVWTRVVSVNRGYLISSDNHSLEIPTNYLKRTLRKPGNYQGFVTPKVEDYALSIPNNPNDNTKGSSWLKRYIEITQQFAKPAKKKFGDSWIHHISHQLNTKQPWGHLFIADKFGITTVTNNVYFVDNRITCTKNFYVLVNKSDREAKFLGAWLNSSFYFLLFICSRREIGGSFGRLQIIDYMQESIFLDIAKCSSEDVEKIIRAFDVLRSTKLDTIPNQLSTKERQSLDFAIAEVLGFSQQVLHELYALLGKAFQTMKSRDKSRSTRTS